MARILVVDDDATVRDFVCKVLESGGHEVSVAEDGEKALALYKTQPADLVIADLFMPVLDGLQLIVKLREEYPETKFIAISGSVYERKPRFLEIAGHMEAVLTLSKPFSARELMDVVLEALG